MVWYNFRPQAFLGGEIPETLYQNLAMMTDGPEVEFYPGICIWAYNEASRFFLGSVMLNCCSAYSLKFIPGSLIQML